jgi:hypothetical protein
MKKLLIFVFCLSGLKNLNAQVPTAMSPEANIFYSTAMPAVRQQVKNIVLQTAGAVKNYKANADSLSQKLRANKALKNMTANDIDGITVLILVQASKDADADLKLRVLRMSRRNQKQQEQTTMQKVSSNNVENKGRPAEEVNDMENLKLHEIMERKSGMAQEINNFMKNISGNQQNIINDLR